MIKSKIIYSKIRYDKTVKSYNLEMILMIYAGLMAWAGCVLWFTSNLIPLDNFFIGILLFVIFVLNVSPIVVDQLNGKFDPFDLKFMFLGYFFIMLTVHSICRVAWGIGTGPLEANPNPSDTVRIRALCAILIGLSSFLVGCYFKGGRLIGSLLPCVCKVVPSRVTLVTWLGIISGLLAFWVLTESAGGITEFITNLSTWRTKGVLAGAGHLTVPISNVMPSCALLFVLRYIRPVPQKLSISVLIALCVYIFTLLPVVLLGFRVGLLCAIMQLIAVWHYRRRRLHFRSTLMLCAAVLALLSLYSAGRRIHTDEAPSGNSFLTAVVFRIPGLDTVERVVHRMDQGEPKRGLWSVFVESATILGPRAYWPDKPVPSILAFDDIFLYDYFLGRGDRLDDIKSGMSPTIIGEFLWVGGMPAVALGSFILGTVTVIIKTWLHRAPHDIVRIWISSIVVAPFALFVEAPQNNLNFMVVLAAFLSGTTFILTVRFGKDVK